MSSNTSVRVPGSLAGTPAVRRGGAWWLVSGSRALPADPPLAADLDHLAAALAAADRAVAALHREGRR
jgi:hypothetical protein